MIGRKGRQNTEIETAEPKSFDDYETRLGDLMRGERATLGKSLLDVQRELRIKAAYIAAIENCDPSVFETPGFIAGYVRSYARYLGMDPDLVFQAFCDESGFATAHGMSSEASSRKRDDVEAHMSAAAVKSDPLVDPRTAFVPPTDTMLTRIEPGAVGSVLVLALLLGGIGYGGWTVLQEVQKVQLSPVEQTPIAVSDLDPLTAATNRVETEQVAQLDAPTQALDRLYRPQALDVPVLIARDAPISTLDPRRTGSFVSPVEDSAPRIATAPADALPISRHKGVTVMAARPSWMQIEGADGVLFEGTMNAGDTYPLSEDTASLVVGRAGAVYLMVDGQVYGPTGPQGQSLGGIDLTREAVLERFALADIPADEDLKTLVAELDVNQRPAAATGGAPVQIATPALPGRPRVYEDGQPVVTVLASAETWVLIKDAAGARLFEAVLQAGDTYTVPQTENPPVIRTGNAGAVYFNVGGETLGPYGDRGAVRDNQQLTATALASAYDPVDPTRLSEDVQKVVAELARPLPLDN
ncbi:helix-turn-helix domain-containing protein [Pseudaestuariivita atlantica]|uniref:Cytoskeleton protein RodZ-like C-terminal domain-containing protein n=1 Tax=Pseudaestuariivita atlantica TaxID=1317121 RepID=A0A0L1JU59_9RHOB|nr:helix-turn-helix domain-containing protein [Pseudaestuariivita atlantica]KNG95290.1 hypothetical protein ATO11_01260 [Pseudaestuariivita atlantica]